MKEDTTKTLVEHILELRSVILSSAIYIVLGMLVSFLFSKQIFDFLIEPLRAMGQSKMIYTSIIEPATTEFRIAFYVSLLLTSPLILRKIWWFISPGLLHNEIVMIKKHFFIICALFVCGIVFAYYVVIPNTISVLMNWSFGKDSIFLPKMSENIMFILVMMLAFGISFQIPVIMVVLDKLNLIPFAKQRKWWREYTACIAIISAVITPPDIISMLFLAVPLILLYYVTIFVAHLR
ncbi:MAG: twin-arginine translocase subunit TatC, partial [Holosporales bacterium]|nr:twin-arginine translocase subunit TatC [Holosporales bacterium]